MGFELVDDVEGQMEAGAAGESLDGVTDSFGGEGAKGFHGDKRRGHGLTKEAIAHVGGEGSACGLAQRSRALDHRGGSFMGNGEKSIQGFRYCGICAGVREDHGFESVDVGREKFSCGIRDGGMSGLSTHQFIDIVGGTIDDALGMTTVQKVA